jgi:hypothetical protein
LTQETIVILNRTGQILGFLSFWFAAPEIIGENRLKSWSSLLEKGAFNIPILWALLYLLLLFYVLIDYLIHALTIGRIFTFPEDFAVRIILLFMASSTPIYPNILKPRKPNALLIKAAKFFADNQKFRHWSLFLGGFLFTISFILQFAATY